MPLTLEEKTRFHQVLKQTNGDRKLAAEVLGITPEELKDRLHKCPELKEAWCESKTKARTPPSEIETLSREPMDAEARLLTINEIKSAEAMAREESLLREGVSALNLSDRDREMAVSLCSFNKKHFLDSINIISGGVTRMSITVQTKMDDVRYRIAELEKKLDDPETVYEPEFREAITQELRTLYETFTNMGHLATKTFEISQKGMLTQAEIYSKVHGKSQEKKKKAGYAEK